MSNGDKYYDDMRGALKELDRYAHFQKELNFAMEQAYRAGWDARSKDLEITKEAIEKLREVKKGKK